MANSEDIEARLCAYLEGDLDAAGRAEIEKHLLSHPQHRLLIEELARTRDLVRQLPRAKAPPELSDSLQGSMERKMLLGGDADADVPPRHRWLPQMGALAALLALTVGLGTIVYFVLQASFNRSHVTPVAATDTVQNPVAFGVAPSPQNLSTGAEGGAVSKAIPVVQAPVTPAAIPISAPLAPTTMPEVVVTAAPTGGFGGGAPLSADLASQNRKLEVAGGTILHGAILKPAAESARLYIVLSTPDPQTAVARVSTLLDQRQMRYSKETDASYRSILQDLKTEALVNASGGASTVPNLVPGEGGTIITANVGNGNGNLASENDEGEKAQIVYENGLAFAATQPTLTRRVVISSLPPSFLIHDVAPDQVDQLGRDLTASNPDNHYAVIDHEALQTVAVEKKDQNLALEAPVAMNAPATTQPLDDALAQPIPLHAGDLVNVYLNGDDGGNAAAQQAAQAVAPAAAQTAIVAADGTLKLPNIAAVPAAGKMPQDVEKSIALAYRDANLDVPPDIVVSRIQPAFADRLGEQAPATQLADKVDLVVVIQATGTTGLVTGSGPTTMPTVSPTTLSTTQP